MGFLDNLIVRFDEATGFYEKAKALNSHLKGEQVWGELLRTGAVIKDGVTGLASSPWTIIRALVDPLGAFKDFGQDVVKGILFGGQDLSDGTIPPEVKGQPLRYAPPNPSSSGGFGNGGEDSQDLIRDRSSDPPTPAQRKITSGNTSPGFRSTKITPPITAATQISSRSWGELICYPVRETGEIDQVPESAIQSVGIADGVASKSLDEWLAIQLIPGESHERDEKKKELGYLNVAAVIVPGGLKGLSGGLSVRAGVGGILGIARALSVRSVNAYIGFEPELYYDIQVNSISAGDAPTVEFEETPYLTGTVMQGEVTRSLMGIELLNKIMDFDWGVKGTPEDILKGWGLMQFAEGGESESFRKSAIDKISNGEINQFMRGIENTTEGNKVQINSFPDLLTHLAAADYFRSGHHRYPQEVPESLNRRTWEEGKAPLMEIGDAGQYQEWVVDQLDSLLGQWPTSIRVKTTDKNGNAVRGEDGKNGTLVDLPNLAEGMAEMLTLLFNVNLLTEHNHQLQIKSIVENFKDFNQNTMTHDHVVAITKFLGYHGETYSEKLSVPFNPKATSLIQFQKPSEQNQVRWRITDALVLKEEMIKMAINAAKAASAVWQKYKPGDLIPGERIKEQRKEEQKATDDEWKQFLEGQNEPTGYAKTDVIPNSKLGDRPRVVDKTKPRSNPPVTGE